MGIFVLFARGALGLLVLWVVTAALLPGGVWAGEAGILGGDKARHIFLFFLLALVSAGALPDRPIWQIGLGLAALGLAIELIQPLVGRSYSLADMAANLVGLAGALPLAALVRRYLRRRPGGAARFKLGRARR